MSPYLERYLSESEIDYVQNVTFSAGFAIAYKGELDIEAMRMAYSALVDRYPVLRARIVSKSGKMALCAPRGSHPKFFVAEGGWETLVRELKDFNEIRKDDVSSLHIIRNGSIGYVVLGADHLIVAAGAFWTYMAELWQLYTDIVNGKTVDSYDGKKLPGPGDEFTPIAPSTPKALSGGISNKDSLYLTRGGPSVYALEKTPDQTTSYTDVDADRAHQIKKACRAHRIGLGNYIGSVMATVLRDRNSTQGEMPVNLIVAIDHAAGRVNFTDVTVSHVRHRIQLNVNLHDDPFAVSVQLKNKIDYAKRNRVFIEDFETGDYDIHLNGYGKLDLKYPNNLELDFDQTRGAVIGKPTLSQPAIKNGDASQLPPLKPFVTISSITFNDQLRVQVAPWQIDGHDGESLRDDFIHRLTSTA